MPMEAVWANEVYVIQESGQSSCLLDSMSTIQQPPVLQL